ncbi:MAG: EAL domain-containing protein, partial [Hyphomicrobiales bacterium]
GFALSIVPTKVPGFMLLGVHKSLDADRRILALVENAEYSSGSILSKKNSSETIRISLANGETVAQFGVPIIAAHGATDDYVEVRQDSQQFPLSATATIPRSELLAAFEQVTAFAKIGGGIMGVIMLVLGGAVARRLLTGQNEIGDAILAGEFIPFYQPIVDAHTGRVSGCEVLVRWRKPSGELVRPDLFIPQAESTGQIIEITRQLMHQVSRDMAPICAVQPDFYTSLNLVAEHFTSNEIVSDIRQKFSTGAMTPANLVVEITERRPLLDMDRAKMVIESLQRLGVRVALDDAGTGHGGLAYIQSLGMDIIKIDRMFVEAIGTDAPSAPIVDALVDLGKQLQMTIIAEGVETESQFAYLQERGARYFQGFLFSPPMPIGAFVKFIGAFNPVVEQSPHTMAIEPPAPRPARALAGSA